MEARSNALKELITGKMQERRMNLERLANLSEIPEHYLQAILDGSYDSLPPRPYVRGYLIKLSEILDLDEDEVLTMHHKEQLQSAGAEDKLPGRRNVASKINIRWIAAGVIVLAIIAYAVFFSLSSGTPYIEFDFPPSSTSPYVSRSALITFRGNIDPSDDLFINDTGVAVEPNGDFSFEYQLNPGLNNIEFRVKRFLGKEISVSKQVIYERGIFLEDGELESASEEISTSTEQ